ncbi:protein STRICTOSIDINE SYNTHASE-LIKE 6-like [Spinacia oleracea]|uniref:Protein STRICTOSIDINE SYNTHASE-LIKE 6-like n=1 Tax=Spinacia oleracea TaxID=3562 RepID=A0ABM3QYM9_SPIOL|nr:protein STRICTOSIDINE SYNTHASE-LIKE 6-like [Spinacia oleracea]
MNQDIKLLTDEDEGKKFKLTEGVDISRDGTIYFTDASCKYALENCLRDILEGRPYGRLLSYSPNTGETKVLLKDLYFPNGVAVSPDQQSLVFCETPLKRCRTYWIQGSKKGAVDAFIDNLPGFPDNIHCDGHNSYWIGLSSWLNPKLHVYDPAMSMITSGIKIENYLYIGSLHYDHIIRFNLSYS